MLEELLTYIGTLDIIWIYFVLFFFSFIENVFPPSPSDVVVIVGASLISTNSLGFVPVLLITSIGSAMGFILMYYVGYYFSDNVMKSKRLKFISSNALSKTSLWFNKYGYWIILANRFLPGTRSVISFFSGVHSLRVFRTFLFALISAFLWNLIIVYLGMVLGNNVELIDYYLSSYSKIGLGITIFVVLIFFVRHIIKRKQNA